MFIKYVLILGKSENTFSILQWLSMRNSYFQAWDKTEAICPQNNIAEIYFVIVFFMIRSNFTF